MANNRPALWWQSAPVIKDGKVRCVANAASGEETTDWFSLAEIVAYLIKRPWSSSAYMADKRCKSLPQQSA
jgi:hypothetical protein